jgi:putative endonuclease
MKAPAVYILANKKNGTLYTGVTSDLIKRIWQHRNNQIEASPKNIPCMIWSILSNIQKCQQRFCVRRKLKSGSEPGKLH